MPRVADFTLFMICKMSRNSAVIVAYGYHVPGDPAGDSTLCSACVIRDPKKLPANVEITAVYDDNVWACDKCGTCVTDWAVPDPEDVLESFTFRAPRTGLELYVAQDPFSDIWCAWGSALACGSGETPITQQDSWTSMILFLTDSGYTVCVRRGPDGGK